MDVMVPEVALLRRVTCSRTARSLSCYFTVSRRFVPFDGQLVVSIVEPSSRRVAHLGGTAAGRVYGSCRFYVGARVRRLLGMEGGGLVWVRLAPQWVGPLERAPDWFYVQRPFPVYVLRGKPYILLSTGLVKRLEEANNIRVDAVRIDIITLDWSPAGTLHTRIDKNKSKTLLRVPAGVKQWDKVIARVAPAEATAGPNP